MSHARPPPDLRPPPSQRLWAALRPSPQATPGQTDAAYTPTDTKALALKHQGVEPGAAVEAAAAPAAAVAAVSSPATAAPAAVVPRKDSLFTSPLARNTSLSEPVTPAEIKRVTQLQQFDSLSRKATKEEEAPAHSKVDAPVWIGPKPVGPVAEAGGAGGRLVGFTDGKNVFLRKEGKGGPLLCNLTSSEGLDLAAGGAAAVSVRGFSADGKWLLASSGEKALVAFPVGGTTPVEVVAGGKGVAVGGVHCVDTQEDFSGVLVEVTGLVPGGTSAVFRASLDPVMPLQLDTMAPLSPGSPETWLVDTPSGAVLGVVFADGKRRLLLMREPLPRKRIAEPPSFGAWKEGAEWSEASGTRYVGFSGGLAWLQDFYSGDVTAVATDGTTHRIRNR